MNLFGILNTIATYMLFVYNLLHYREKRNLLGGVSRGIIQYFQAKPSRGINKILSAAGIWTVLEIILISLCQYNLGGYFNAALGKLLNTGANYFGLIFAAPVLVGIACALLKIEYLAQMDLITPAYPLALFISKIACRVTGCCRGVEWEYGFYNPVSRLIEFPAQLLESGVALLMFVFLLCFKKKMKKGTVFPVYLILYSGTRFFTEFTRWEPEVFMGLKLYQILCLIGVLVGVLGYVAVCRYTARNPREA